MEGQKQYDLNVTFKNFKKSKIMLKYVLKETKKGTVCFMSNTNLAEKIVENNFPEWDYLAKETARVFELSKKETENLYNSNTAKIIAAIPFVAKCREPERTAIAHLCIYEAEIKGFQKYYAHLPCDDDDLYNRLAFISTFEGGNQAIINHGMNILAYIMIEGYNRSKEKDLKDGIYNPIANGQWDYKKLKKELQNKINEIECPELDKYFVPIKAVWIDK